MRFIILRIQLETSFERVLCSVKLIQTALDRSQNRQHILSFFDRQTLFQQTLSISEIALFFEEDTKREVWLRNSRMDGENLMKDLFRFDEPTCVCCPDGGSYDYFRHRDIGGQGSPEVSRLYPVLRLFKRPCLAAEAVRV